ncbi:MAG: hypothetical protein HYU69_11335 [Bacteroidetes bacterium]|nr:hypothetical protein [Bacteroidota bacterium]
MKHLKYLLYILFVFISSLGIISCCCSKKAASATDTAKKQEVPDYEKAGYARATVIKYEVDGCGYLLQLGSGKKLEVLSLPEELKQEKKEVWIKYELDKNAASICMAGDIIKLTDYKVIK